MKGKGVSTEEGGGRAAETQRGFVSSGRPSDGRPRTYLLGLLVSPAAGPYDRQAADHHEQRQDEEEDDVRRVPVRGGGEIERPGEEASDAGALTTGRTRRHLR